MNQAFNYRNKFSEDISQWDLSNVKDISYMLYSCQQLDFLDLSQWNVTNVTNMSLMFYNCFYFTSDLSN